MEALFFFAEQKRALACPRPLAPYRGDNSYDSVAAYRETIAFPWFMKCTKATLDIGRSYLQALGVSVPAKLTPAQTEQREALEFVQLKPFDSPADPLYIAWPDEPPSPRWAILAAERIGTSWAEIAESLRSVPPLPRWKVDKPPSSLRWMSKDILEAIAATERAKARAKAAFAYCRRLSSRLYIEQQALLRCEGWLSQHFGAEYNTVTEFMPPFSWSFPVMLRAEVATLVHAEGAEGERAVDDELRYSLDAL